MDKALTDNGIGNKTIVTHKNQLHAIIIDEGVEIFDPIMKTKNQLGSTLSFYRGDAKFLGYYDEDGSLGDQEHRDRSLEVFNQTILRSELR